MRHFGFTSKQADRGWHHDSFWANPALSFRTGVSKTVRFGWRLACKIVDEFDAVLSQALRRLGLIEQTRRLDCTANPRPAASRLPQGLSRYWASCAWNQAPPQRYNRPVVCAGSG
jgi:hypothetical protein